MDAINWHSLFFLLFAGITCSFALAVVFTANIVRMAFFLIISLAATAGLFFLAGADFVGAMQLVLYVGGTLVLLVFGVMLTAQSPFISIRTSGGDWILAALVGGSMLAILVPSAILIGERGTEGAEATTVAVGSTSAAHLVQIEFMEARERRENDINVRYAKKEAEVALSEYERALVANEGVLGVISEAEMRTKKLMAERAQAELDILRRRRTATAAVVSASSSEEGESRTSPAPVVETKPTATNIGQAFVNVRVDKLTEENEVKRRGMSGYLLPFEIVSIHLLVVLVGAAFLARSKRRVKSKFADA